MKTIPELLNILAPKEGLNTSNVKSINLFRVSHARKREPFLYEKGIIIIGQGSKNMYFGNQKFTYNKDAYLVVPFPVPVECETITAPENPLLGMTIDINPIMLNNLVSQMDNDTIYDQAANTPEGLFTDTLNTDLKNTLIRLLKALSSSVESMLFAEDIIKEFLYRVLQGPNAYPLLALASKNTTIAKIEKALQIIHSDITAAHSIPILAKSVFMSESAFHKAFKEATSSSPIQYIKKVRLNKAKDLIVIHGTRANEAAQMVGYESTTQFSREFKRYFGHTPKESLLVE